MIASITQATLTRPCLHRRLRALRGVCSFCKSAVKATPRPGEHAHLESVEAHSLLMGWCPGNPPSRSGPKRAVVGGLGPRYSFPPPILSSSPLPHRSSCPGHRDLELCSSYHRPNVAITACSPRHRRPIHRSASWRPPRSVRLPRSGLAPVALLKPASTPSRPNG